MTTKFLVWRGVGPVRQPRLASRARAAIFLASTVSAAVTRADSFTWDGGGNGYYNIATDWIGNVAPQSTDTLAMLTFGSTNYNNDNPTDSLGYQPYSITFDQTAIPYNLSGTSGKTLGVGPGGITDMTAAAETISEPVAVDGDQTWYVSSGTGAAALTAGGGISGSNKLTLAGSGTVLIGGTSSYSGKINVSGGSLQFSAGGKFTGSGTSSLINLGTMPGQSVAATVAGGNVSVGAVNIGDGTGAGTTVLLSQAAGSLSATRINIGGAAGDSGYYNLSGSGVVNAVLFNIGSAGTGVFNQTGGQLTVTGTFSVPAVGGLSGTMLLSGNAIANVPTMQVGSGGPGMINQSGGTLNASGDVLIQNGTFVISNGTDSVQNFQVGFGGDATAVQSGGTLNTVSVYVGSESTGTFNQSGGTSNAPGGYILGLDSGTNGTVNFTGGTLNTPLLTVGNFGTGTFVQTGGIVNVAQGSMSYGLVLGQSPGSNGIYQLSGGQLQGGVITGGNGTGLLQFNGGTFVITVGGAGGLQEVPTTILAGGAFFNTPSGVVSRVTVTLQRDPSVSIDGGLTKQGGGRLDLQNYNTYNGPTMIQAGTLVLDYGYDGAHGTINYASAISVSAGTLQLGADAGENNTLGLGTFVSPLIVASGASVTEYAGTTQTLGTLTLTGGTVTGSGSPPGGSPDFTLTGNVGASGVVDSMLSAPGGIGLAGTITFSVAAGGGRLLVQGLLVDANGFTGSLNKLGRGAALVLSGDDTYSGPTTITAGTLQLTPTASLPNSAISVTGKLEFTAQPAGSTPLVRPLSTLSIRSGGAVVVDAPVAPVDRQLLVVSSLTFGTAAAGSLDLTGNDADIQTGNLSTIEGEIAQGYNLVNGANWQGSAGITSSTAAANPSHLTGLGVVQNNQSGSAVYTEMNPFDTYAPGTGDILIKYTYSGDANLDGKVDGSDYSLIDAGYSSHGSKTGWYFGDFNYDGVVDGSDYSLIDNAFNNQSTPINPTALTAEITAEPAAVPEPAAGLLVAASAAIAAAFGGRRRLRTSRTRCLRFCLTDTESNAR